MPFEFNNEPPPQESAFGAFKALPAFSTSKRGITPTSAAPFVINRSPLTSLEKPGTPAKPFAFSPRNASPDGSPADEQSAMDFFLSSAAKKPVAQKDYRYLGEGEPKKRPSDDSNRFCSCDERYLPRPKYRPSMAAHTFPYHSTPPEQPFRLLDLPAEMRNRIYQAALVPGYISLRTCIHNHPTHIISPSLTPGLLRASKLLAHETANYLFENTLIITLAIQSGCRPVFSPFLLPRNILGKIKHATFLCDFSRPEKSPLRTGNWNVTDYRPLQHLTALRTARIAGLSAQPNDFTAADMQEVYTHAIKDILERVPASCTVSYGLEAQEEEGHADDLLRRMKWNAKSHKFEDHIGEASVVGLEDVAEKVEVERGCKSGSELDWRFVGKESWAEYKETKEMRSRRKGMRRT